ncbi:MAG: thiamine phosphate synthase [Methanomassiliicoccaceae archaeon]|nr:thiamine phosphate synthase [Methanomassiliicoccaceae archaeon]
MQPNLTLYLVTDSTNIPEDRFLKIIEQACSGGVTIVQLREKEKDGKEYLELAEKVKRITDRYDIPLIIDDRADIAMAADASGVHVGQSDIPVRHVRRLLGNEKIIGASAKTAEQGMTAKKEGADYLGVGAIYPTTTKVITKVTEISTLNEIALRTELPTVAIGGLNGSNMHVLYESRANGIAVVSAIMKSDDPQETARSLKEQVLKNFRSKRSE